MLIYPDQADISAANLMPTPVKHLIGFSKDQSIKWQTPTGDWRSLTILAVGDVPPGSGYQSTPPAKKNRWKVERRRRLR